MTAKPKTLYKYFPIDDNWLAALLSGESMQFSSRKTFNDPFDSRPLYRVPQTDEAIRWIARNLRREYPGLTDHNFLTALGEIAQKAGQVGAFEESGINEFLDDTGILSLTTAWDNALLWAHYASHHKGMCIGFSSDKDVFATAEKVQYSHTLPVISKPGDSDREMLRKTFFFKSKCWSYEREWRAIKVRIPAADMHHLIVQTGDPDSVLACMREQNGPDKYRYDRSAIESITIGTRISEDDEKLVLRRAEEAGLKIPIYKIRKPAKVYKLSRDVLFDLR